MSMLNGRVAIVTGGAQSIGAAFAKGLAAEGARVVIADIAPANDILGIIKQAGGVAMAVACDVTDEASCRNMVAEAIGAYGKLDILVANAGALGTLTPAAQITPKDWNAVLGLNLVAPARMIAAFEPLLLASDAGRAVFISSGAVDSRRAYWGAYAASKAGMDALVQSWANEHANGSVRINILYPGQLRTQMRAKAFPGEDPATLSHPEVLWPALAELVDPACARHGEIIKFSG